jgi:hypothetical protein
MVNAGVGQQITADETDADALDLFDSTARTGKRTAVRQALFNVRRAPSGSR